MGDQYHVDSRDGSVTVHNNNFNQLPIYRYTYRQEGGDLLSLSIKTEKKSKGVDIFKSSSIDPKSKNVNTSIHQVITKPHDQIVDKAVSTLKKVAAGKEVLSRESELEKQRRYDLDSVKDEKTVINQLNQSYQLTNEDIQKGLAQIKNEFSTILDEYKTNPSMASLERLVKANSLSKVVIPIRRKVRTVVNPTTYSTIGDNKQASNVTYHNGTNDASNYSNKWIDGYNHLKNSESIILVGTVGKLPKGSIVGVNSFPNVEVILEKDINLSIDGARVFSSATPQMLSDSISSNEASDIASKVVTMSLKALGNTHLESSKVVEVDGISELYSGKWYTKKVKHSINSSSGYTVEAELIKTSPITISTVNTSVNTQKGYSDIISTAKVVVKKDKLPSEVLSDIKTTIQDRAKTDRKYSESSEIIRINELGNSALETKVEVSSKNDKIDIVKERSKIRSNR